MRDWLINKIIERAKQTPYFHLDGYMERYWLVPYKNSQAGAGCGPVSFLRRPLAWLLQQFGIAIRVHHILRSDDARAFHDHPWWYATCILRGGYREVIPTFKSGVYSGNVRRGHGAGRVLFRRAESWHRLELEPGETAWTLFITGSYRNAWGFLVQPNFKMPWRDYAAKFLSKGGQ